MSKKAKDAGEAPIVEKPKKVKKQKEVDEIPPPPSKATWPARWKKTGSVDRIAISDQLIRTDGTIIGILIRGESGLAGMLFPPDGGSKIVFKGEPLDSDVKALRSRIRKTCRMEGYCG